MKRKFKTKDGILTADIQSRQGELKVVLDGVDCSYQIDTIQPFTFAVTQNGILTIGYAVREKNRYYVQIGSSSLVLDEINEEDEVTSAGNDGTNPTATAPMPGAVTKLLVSEGVVVRRNQTLVIVEAMKMENEVKSPIDGIVDKILVTAGRQVGAGEELVKLVAKPSEG